MRPPPSSQPLENVLHGFRSQSLPQTLKFLFVPEVWGFGKFLEQVAREIEIAALGYRAKTALRPEIIKIGENVREYVADDAVAPLTEETSRCKEGDLPCLNNHHLQFNCEEKVGNFKYH